MLCNYGQQAITEKHYFSRESVTVIMNDIFPIKEPTMVTQKNTTSAKTAFTNIPQAQNIQQEKQRPQTK